jgi:hypothetical protein
MQAVCVIWRNVGIEEFFILYELEDHAIAKIMQMVAWFVDKWRSSSRCMYF